MLTKAPRGTKDWYGLDIIIKRKIEDTFRDLMHYYHVKEMETPVFEHTELFLRGVGETTDVVQKEMYTFMDKGNRSITLKPEGTAGFARSFVENHMYANPQPTKLFYITPAFRYEKPQAGRFRQHHQAGLEIFGSSEPIAEVELISVLRRLFQILGIKNAQLHINSIGCSKCRQEYNKALMTYLKKHEDGLCETCKERMEKNPLRILDCKNPSCRKVIKDAPRTIDYLCEECQQHFEALKQMLDTLNIPYVVDTNIVRGLDYYTKTVFEFIDADGVTICGGGRYDNLINEISGKEVPAVGFGCGLERLMLALTKEGITLAEESVPDIYIGILGAGATAQAYELVTELRHNQIIVETDYLGRSVKAQMKYANKIGAKYTVIIGENEIAENEVQLKNMETGETNKISLNELVNYFKQLN